MDDARWRIVGIAPDGSRFEMPIDWPTRERAEEIAAFADRVLPVSFTVVIEKAETIH